MDAGKQENINNGKRNANEVEQERHLEVQQERYRELEKLIGSQESRIQSLQSSAFQLANYYFMFQGVILAAISNTTSLTCSDSWFIFTLSIVAAILNLFALLSIAIKYVRAMGLHDQTWSEFNRTAASIYQNGNPPDSLGFTGDFKDNLARARRYAVLTCCMALFLVFTAATLAGPWLVTCKHDRQNRHRHPGSDCIKLCDHESSSCMFFCQAMPNP